MHRTQADGFETVDGKDLFQDTEPLGTRAEAVDLNTLQEEMCQAVEASGQTLNTPATDAGTGNFNDASQVLAAILSLAGRHPTLAPLVADIENGVLLGDPAGATIKTINADPFTVTGLFHHIRIQESGGPFTDGLVKLEEDAAYAGRLIYVTNATNTRKRIRSASDVGVFNAFEVTIQPGHTAQLIQLAGVWRLVRIVKNSGTFALDLFDGVTSLASATATWERDPQERTIRLHVPELSGVIVTGTAVRLAFLFAGLPSAVPQALHPDVAAARRFPLCIVDTVGAAVKPWRWNGADYYESDLVVPAGAFTVREQTVQYSR